MVVTWQLHGINLATTEEYVFSECGSRPFHPFAFYSIHTHSVLEQHFLQERSVKNYMICFRSVENMATSNKTPDNLL